MRRDLLWRIVATAILLIVFLPSSAPATAQGGTVYTTPDGQVQFMLPPNYRVLTVSASEMLIVNHALEPGGDLTPGTITITLDTQVPQAELLNSISALASEFMDNGASGRLIDTLQLGNREVVRLRSRIGDDVLGGYAFFVDTQIFRMTVRSGDSNYEGIEQLLQFVIASFSTAVETSSLPDVTAPTPTLFVIPTAVADSAIVDVTAPLQIVVTWFAPLPPVDVTLLPPPSIAMISDDRLLIHTASGLQVIDLNGGALLLDAIPAEPIAGPITNDADGNVLTMNADSTALLTLDPADFSVLSRQAIPLSGERVVVDVASGQAGAVGVLGIVPRSIPATGTVIVVDNDRAVNITTLQTPPITGEFVSNPAALLIDARGEAILIDSSLLSLRLLPALNVQLPGELRIPDIIRQRTLIPAAAIAPDGTRLVLTENGLFLYDALGGVLGFSQATRRIDSSGAFERGELPPYGDVLPLDNNEWLIVGYTATDAVAMRVTLRTR